MLLSARNPDALISYGKSFRSAIWRIWPGSPDFPNAATRFQKGPQGKGWHSGRFVFAVGFSREGCQAAAAAQPRWRLCGQQTAASRRATPVVFCSGGQGQQTVRQQLGHNLYHGEASVPVAVVDDVVIFLGTAFGPRSSRTAISAHQATRETPRATSLQE